MIASRTWVRILAGFGVFLAVVATRVVVSSHDDLVAGRTSLAGDDVDAAIVHFRRAARGYTPANPYCADALTQLMTIADASEREGEIDRALMAYRAARSAILATRSFYTPHTAVLDAANARIASLMAAEPAPAIDAGKSKEQLEREHLALLQQDTQPKLFWSLVLLCGFVTWVGAAFALASKGFETDGRFNAPVAKRYVVMIALGFAAFVIGLLNA